jgi:hypothetical protein
MMRRKRKPQPPPVLCTPCHRSAQRLILERDGERFPFCSVACLIRWIAPRPAPEQHSTSVGLI